MIFLAAFLLAIGLAAIFLFSWSSFLLLLLSFSLATLYNIYSKRIPGFEYIAGASVFTIGLFGASTSSLPFSALALLMCLLISLQWVFSVGVSANLKDVEYDTQLGIRTTPVLLGVHRHEDHLVTPVKFTLYAYGLQAVFLFVACLPYLLGYTSIILYGYLLPLLGFIILTVLLLFTTRGILTASLRKRNLLLRYIGAHEGFALLLIPFVLLSYLVEHVGVLPPLFLILLLIAWPLFSLRLLFGKTLIPLE
jgi:4-hydroxybenzoate polyprenyltransferase